MPTIEIVKCQEPDKGFNVVLDGKFAQYAYNKAQARGIEWILKQAVYIITNTKDVCGHGVDPTICALCLEPVV